MGRLWLVAGMVAFLTSIALPVSVGAQLPATVARERIRVFVAPIADFALGQEGPTRYEYVSWLSQQECVGIVPTAREDLADFTFWFEFEDLHYVLVWDAEGDLVGSSGAVLMSENVVKDACNIIWEQSELGSETRRLESDAERQRLEQRRQGNPSTPECDRLATQTPDQWRRMSESDRSALREACRSSRH